MERETIRQRNNALITTGQFLADAALTAVGGGAISGPLTSALGTAAKLAYKLHLLGIEFQETSRGKMCLTRPLIGPELFRVCPLAGAYFISGVEDFALLNMLTVDFGSKGWEEDVLLLKPGLEGVRKSALSLMDGSVFKIRGLPSPHVRRTTLGSHALGQAQYRYEQVFR